ncbi:MAG: hypothetical protein U0Q18_17940 [Bryobacteraceae bacterium]
MDVIREQEALLGYDAREIGVSGIRRLEQAGYQATQYLLRTDIEDVLSADTMIWPSIFGPTLATSDGPVLPAPEWIGMNAPFWEDLNALRNAIPSGFGRTRSLQIIAATWHSDSGFEEEATQPGKIQGPHVSPTTPQNRDPDWRFLGFDITDPGISGLSNCGYEEIERDRLAAQWGPRLNRFHLFDSLDCAFEFRKLTNARVPEHAPFFVLGLWVVTSLRAH